MVAAGPERRQLLALYGFGYWHYGLLLGIVGLAAGLKKTIGAPYEELETVIAFELAAGVALFVACGAGFRRALGLEGNRVKLVTALGALATIPLGTQVSGAAQIPALVTILVAALVLAGSRR